MRTEKGLKEAYNKINILEKELVKLLKSTVIAKGYRPVPLKQSPTFNENRIETQNMLLVAKLICKSALKRKKSLGSHFII